MDSLEKHIQENRKQMDELEFVPVDKMWNNIAPEKSIKGELKIAHSSIWKKIAIAASLVALLGWGLWFSQKTEPTATLYLAEIAPDLAEREVELKRLITQKENEINFGNIDTTLYNDILSDLRTIDQNTEETMSDILKIPDERAVETLIRNYELKIRILENLNRQIQKNKNHEKHI
ncbi:MAG: hypothetical protein AAFZ15_02820 [Bacteroidota bacterium]